MTQRPQILCISLSNIESDARVLRQIGVLQEFGDVITVGFGATPDGVAEHIAIPANLKTLPQTPLGVLGLGLHMHRATEVAAPAIQFALKSLAGRAFDLVVANEARVLAMADRVAAGAPIWADMHEWAPEERTHILSWRLLVAPLMRYLCRKYLPTVDAVTTVGQAIAKLYQEQFGVDAVVMRNSGPLRALEPSPTADGQIRLVHSGVAVHGRKLELMIDAIALLDDRFTLDLYLLASADGGAYLRELKARAGDDGRVRFHDGVRPHELPSTLNAYDVGVFWLPPTHTNARLALPNKFFDFVQARLAIAIGPSIEMQTLVEEHDLGVVAAGFTAEECADSIRTLTSADVACFKQASDRAANVLNFEADANLARGFLGKILKTSK